MVRVPVRSRQSLNWGFIARATLCAANVNPNRLEVWVRGVHWGEKNRVAGSPMEKIASFIVNHLVLEPGVYVSRVDADPATGAVVTAFDLRLTAPNREPVMDTAAVHAIEHLGATYLRNDPAWHDQVVYFGPMGCRTVFYLILFGSHTSAEVAPLVRATFEFIRDFEGEIPGARPEECGNWHDADLAQARWWARRYLENTLNSIDEAHLVYSES